MPSKIPLDSFTEQSKSQMIPLNNVFSYFCASPVEEEALRRLLHEPVAAVPPNVGDFIRHVGIILVPFLEHVRAQTGDNGNVDGKGPPPAEDQPTRMVTFERPSARRQLFSATLQEGDQAFVFLGVKDEEVADCHYSFYNSLAGLLLDRLEANSINGFGELIRKELAESIHGEIDDKSWRLKEELMRRQSDPTKDTKLLRNYVRQAFQDTLTLYMHGLCCDIDLEAGPRQLNSRNIRKRLNLLREMLPPPSGFALFPEELNRHH